MSGGRLLSGTGPDQGCAGPPSALTFLGLWDGQLVVQRTPPGQALRSLSFHPCVWAACSSVQGLGQGPVGPEQEPVTG